MNLRSRPAMFAAAAAVALSTLTACGGGGADTPKANKNAPLYKMLPKNLQGKDTLKIASNVEYPPFEFFDSDNKTVLGVDREIADGLEKQLGIGIEFQNISFDAIIPGLESGRYQMAMSAMTDNKERQKQVDFVDYFMAGAGLMSQKSTGDTYKTLDDVCGKTAGLVKGTTEVEQVAAADKKCKSDGEGGIKSIIFPGQNQAVLALQNKRVDVIAMDSAPGAYAAKQAKDLQMSAPYQAEPFGIVFKKDQRELQKAVQKAMEALRKDGTYMKALKKYGLETGAADSFPINGGKK